ncbi:MAG: M6 family metalloprotease domain-containing protein, partial [Bacteroidales bacterium]|nr:M6 family metalloprotease domain-containing protein [Bacteroidales bacterium]
MRKVIAAIFMIALMFQIPLQAAYLTNVPQTLKQPDGKVLNCFATGDEFHNWLHDANNYTIIQDPVTGYYVYASKSGSKLIATKLIAGQADPAAAGLEPGLNLDPADIDKLIHKFDVPELKGMTGGNTIGTLNNIVIFIRFSDQSEYTNSVSTYQTAFNGATGVSMSQFFNEVSGSQLAIRTSLFPATGGTTVVSYQDANPRAYYLAYNATSNPTGYQESDRTQREMTLLKNATLAVKSEIESTGLDYDLNNDGNIDNICYIIQGASAGWSDLLWPHMWSLYTDNVQVGGLRVYKFNFQLSSAFGVSVLCHEMSHSLGFPDLYRYTDKTINPVGQWDVMASNATPPQHQNSYSKWKYGKWFSGLQTISTPGTYTLEPLSTNPFAGYKIVSPKSASEFFVVEYRKKTGTFESGLPGSGLIIYRINSSLNGNSGGPPDEVYVYRPGGTTTVSGNLTAAPFSANSGRTSFTSTSDPACFLRDGSKGGIEITNVGIAGETISFTLSYPSTAPELSVTPASQSMAFGGGTTSFSVENLNEGNMDWTAAVTSGNTWLHITSGSSGMNSGVIELTADANPVENPRTGTIVVTAAGVTGSPKTVTVVQSGNLPVVVISPLKYSTRSAAGSTTFNVSNGGGGNLVWTAAVTEGNTWASILSGASGTNNGTITVSFDSNPDEPIRTGVITVTAVGATGGPKSVTIEQAGSGPMLMVAPETKTIAFNEGSASFSVSNGGGGTMAWTAAVTAGNQWARISSGASGSNSGTINF